MDKKFVSLMIGVLFLFIGLACLQTQPTAVKETPAKPATEVTSTFTWLQEWEKTVAAGKQEAKVAVISRFPVGVRESLAQAFKEKYGIEIEYTVGASAEMLPKIESERRAGMFIRDIVMDGVATLRPLMPDDIIEPMEPSLILPEVKDPNIWRDKRIPFRDEKGKYFMFLSRPGPTILTNTDLVKPEEIKSWRNLLEPRFKKNITIYDPSIIGPGNTLVAMILDIMGIDFLKELARQEPVINRDMRMQVEWVAKGKYPLGVGFEFTLMEEMRGAGAHLAHVVPSEGTYFGSAVGGMAMFSRPPHPNAAKVFINWFLSKEGQTLLARVAKEQSRRIDIIPELAPDRLFQEGINYRSSDTDSLDKLRQEMTELSKDIFAYHFR